ncbi:citrate synthase, partial [Burkholderia sp. TJI49]
MTSLSAPEAAGILGVSVSTLYAYVSRGLLRSLPDGASKRR